MQRYFLKTERLGFREWSIEDAAIAQSLWGDEDVGRFLGGSLSPIEVEEKLRREMESQRCFGVQYWPVFLLQDDVHVGCCGLRQRDIARGIYELGFHLKKDFWSRGLASEAARAVCAFASNHLKAKGLFAGHHPENLASKAVLEKLGFSFTHEEPYGPTGLLHPSYFLSVHADSAKPDPPHCK